MRKIMLFTMCSMLFANVNAQIYSASPYCKFRTSSADVGGSWDDFTRIQIGPLNQQLAARSTSALYDSDYIYLNNVTAPSFTAGSSYSLKLDYEKYDGENMVMTVFIDYNRNNVFEANEVAFNLNNFDPMHTEVTGTISIPKTAISGQTRMRVMMMDTTSAVSTATANACSFAASIRDGNPLSYKNPYYGQAVDFNVNIQAPSAVENVTRETSIILYPNPVTNCIYLKNVADGTMFQIYNLEGQRVKGDQIQNGKIDVHTLVSGMYFIKLLSGNAPYIERFVIGNK